MENDGKRIAAYIRDIISGRPVAEIPRNLVLKVHNALDNNKSKYNINKSQYDRIMHDFKNIEKRFGLNKKEIQNTHHINANTLSTCSNIINDKLSDYSVDIENTVEGLIHGETFENVQTDSINSIIDYCKKRIDQFVIDGDLNEASVHQNILDQTIQLSYERKYLSSMISKKEGISEQVDFLKLRIEEEKEKAESESQKIDQETSNLLKMEELEFTKSQLEFDNVTQQGPPPKFLKLSGKLLNLKQVEKFLIKSKRFSEASKVHEVSSQLEQKELQNQFELFANERETKKKQLYILHQTRINNIQSSSDRKKKLVEQKSQSIINALENTIQNILNKEKDINDLINEEKKYQEDKISLKPINNENIPHIKKKKRVSLKPKQNKKIIKRVHFAENVF